MKFIKLKSRQQTSEQQTIQKHETKRQQKTLEDLQLEYDMNKLKEYQKAQIESVKDKPITDANVDVNLKERLLQFREIIGDDDTDPYVKAKDVMYAIDVYKSQLPPREQVLSGFELKPIPTQFGLAFPSTDGTQAWVKNKDGVWLATNLNLAEEQPDVTTSDVINQYREYNGTFRQFKKDITRHAGNTKSVKQGLKQIRVQEKSTGVKLANVKPVEAPSLDCVFNVDWFQILFWKLLMNFEAKLDIIRIFGSWTILPFEQIMNWILGKIRNIGFSFSFWGFKFSWYPFKWIPLITVWEHIVWFFAVREYELMCSFFRIPKGLTLGTDATPYFLDQVMSGKKTVSSNKLSITQRKMLAVVQLGYNRYGRKYYSETDIKRTLGNILK